MGLELANCPAVANLQVMKVVFSSPKGPMFQNEIYWLIYSCYYCNAIIVMYDIRVKKKIKTRLIFIFIHRRKKIKKWRRQLPHTCLTHCAE